MMLAYSLNQGDLFKQLHAAGVQRVALTTACKDIELDAADSSPGVKCFAGVLGLYSAFELMRSNPKGWYLYATPGLLLDVLE
jgi:hypothetical protein